MKWPKRHLRSAIFIAVVILGTKYAQDLQDWSKLLRYQPTPQIARLATTTRMTDTARRLFYVNQPTIESTKSALNLCKSSEHTVILGTEVRDLSPELTEHYRKYFTDRSAIVALSERYEGVFTTLQDRAKTLSQQLETRKLARDQLIQQVERESANVNSERSNLQSSIATNPQSDHSFRISIFENQVRTYNQLVGELQQQTDTYNQIVNELNSLVGEEQSLVESLQNKSSGEGGGESLH